MKGAPFQDPEVSPDVIFTHPTIIMLVRVQKILGNSAFDKNRFETLEKSPDGTLLVGNFGVSCYSQVFLTMVGHSQGLLETHSVKVESCFL